MTETRRTRKIYYNSRRFSDISVGFAEPSGEAPTIGYDVKKISETAEKFLQSHRITPYGFCQRASKDGEVVYRFGREIAMLNALKAKGMVGDAEYAKIKQSIRKAYHVNRIAETGNAIL